MGREARRNQERREASGFQYPRERECRAIAASIRAALTTLEVRLTEEHELASMLSDAEWVGSFEADPFRPGGAYGADRNRFARAFLRLEQLRRISGALERATQIGNVRNNLSHWVRANIDRSQRRDPSALGRSDPQDFLFELEVAGRLCRWAMADVRFEEPDIIVRLRGLPPEVGSAMAIKRPRELGTLPRALARGAEQVRKSGYPGLVVAGLDMLLHGTDGSGRPATLIECSTPEEAASDASLTMKRATAAAMPTISPLLDEGFGGVILCGLVTYVGVGPPMVVGYRWLSELIVRDGADAAVVRMFDHVLFGKGDVDPLDFLAGAMDENGSEEGAQ